RPSGNSSAGALAAAAGGASAFRAAASPAPRSSAHAQSSAAAPMQSQRSNDGMVLSSTIIESEITEIGSAFLGLDHLVVRVLRVVPVADPQALLIRELGVRLLRVP